MPTSTLNKYDLVADGFAEKSWANLDFDMRHRFGLATRWGTAINRGDSVLEFGCGDGYLAQLFVQSGLRYCGVDQSSQMVLRARDRLERSRLAAEFEVGDVQDFSLTEPVDAIVAFMGAFFTYVPKPFPLLKRLRSKVRKKIILDLNPRGAIGVKDAIQMLKSAGFGNVSWRPFLVPMSLKLPSSALSLLTCLEDVPLVRGVPLHWKFDVLVKGETRPSSKS